MPAKGRPLSTGQDRRARRFMLQLRAMRVPASEGLALLDLAPDVPPDPEDRLPEPRPARGKMRARRSPTL